MFFVTLLLNEVVAWMRSQPGTSSLRALLYMDEVFGYFPPTANPPSKRPMLTLLKQARAHGLGVMLATQNPVDLDYKGLSNMGTWFLGRLQTERDKARVLDGLEGAAAHTAEGFDRETMDRLLSGLDSRVFLLNNVHEDRPVLFHTRWAMSYLRGPLTRAQIRLLAEQGRPEGKPNPEESSTTAESAEQQGQAAEPRRQLPPDINELFLDPAVPIPNDARVLYRPRLLGVAELHYSASRPDIDLWKKLQLAVPLTDPAKSSIWDSAERLPADPLFTDEPDPAAHFADLPSEAARPKNYVLWSKKLKTSLYRDYPLKFSHSSKLKLYSKPDQTEAEFQTELRQHLREERDLQIEKLRKKYAPKLARLEGKIRTAAERVDREESQKKQQQLQTAISLGATVLGALFGRKTASLGNVGRAATTMRGAGRISREKGDMARAAVRVEEFRTQLGELEHEFEEAREALADQFHCRPTRATGSAGPPAQERHPGKQSGAAVGSLAGARQWHPGSCILSWVASVAGISDSSFEDCKRLGFFRAYHALSKVNPTLASVVIAEAEPTIAGSGLPTSFGFFPSYGRLRSTNRIALIRALFLSSDRTTVHGACFVWVKKNIRSLATV